MEGVMDIHWAIEQLKQGRQVRRTNWKNPNLRCIVGKNGFVCIQTGDDVLKPDVEERYGLRLLHLCDDNWVLFDE